MPNVFEHAPTGRAKCRGCGQPIAKDELRFGEAVPNPYAEGETNLWYHPLCAAYKRPEALLQTLGTGDGPSDREPLEKAANSSLAHSRLQRIDGAERAPSSQARCKHCKEPLTKGGWRIRLVFYGEGRFEPGGFVHFDCRADYFETADVLQQVLHFSPKLEEKDREELRAQLDGRS